MRNVTFYGPPKKCDITVEDQLFGRVVAYVYTIEFQKRGLPHCHMLLTLHVDDIIKSVQLDKLICAEIPNLDQNPRLFEIVKKFMIHGPCGALNTQASCMENGVCKKKFPKPFSSETRLNKDGYRSYSRSDDGKTIAINAKKIATIGLLTHTIQYCLYCMIVT